MKEIWKDIEGYEGLYRISNKGRVYSVGKKIILKNYFQKRIGYFTITLRKEKKYKTLSIHRLVASAFVRNIHSKPQVNHIDGIKTNNISTNLEWVTISENSIHAYKIGLMDARGIKNGRSKLSELQVRIILHTLGDLHDQQIADCFSVSFSCISGIKQGRSWGHLRRPEKQDSLASLIGAPHSKAKLNPLQIRVMRKLKGDMPYRDIANIFNAKYNNVKTIMSGKSWKNL